MALSQINLKKRLHIIMCISVIIHKFLTYYNAIIKQVNFVNEKFIFAIFLVAVFIIPAFYSIFYTIYSKRVFEFFFKRVLFFVFYIVIFYLPDFLYFFVCKPDLKEDFYWALHLSFIPQFFLMTGLFLCVSLLQWLIKKDWKKELQHGIRNNKSQILISPEKLYTTSFCIVLSWYFLLPINTNLQE